MSENKGIYIGDWHTSVPDKITKNSDLSIKARYFWVLLRSFMSKKKQVAYPSIEHLSKIADCTNNTVIKYLKELEKKKLLYRSKKVGDVTYCILSPKTIDIEHLSKNDEKLREKIKSGGEFSYWNFSNMAESNFDSSNQSSTNNKENPEQSNTNKEDTKVSLSNPEEKYNNYAPINGRGLDYDSIKEQFNQIVPGDRENRRCYSIGRKRKKRLRERFKEPEFNWSKLLEKLELSDWLFSDDFQQNLFSWIIKNQENYIKIIEGSYIDWEEKKKEEERKEAEKKREEAQKYKDRVANQPSYEERQKMEGG